jgi:hypothetical protein
LTLHDEAAHTNSDSILFSWNDSNT